VIVNIHTTVSALFAADCICSFNVRLNTLDWSILEMGGMSGNFGMQAKDAQGRRMIHAKHQQDPNLSNKCKLKTCGGA
jgi:hypothetical protein